MKYILPGLCCLLLSLPACSSKKEPEPQELGAPSADPTGPSLDTPEAVLLREAQHMYSRGFILEAEKSFRALRDGHPFGPYAQYAQLKLADCSYYTSQYSDAVSMFDDFVKEYPHHEAAPYAKLRAAHSFLLMVNGTGRNAGPLYEAKERVTKMIEEHPNSKYLAAAKRLQHITNEKLSAYDLYILDFYKRRGKDKAIKQRQTELVQNWGKSEEQMRELEDLLPAPVLLASAKVDPASTSRAQSVQLPQTATSSDTASDTMRARLNPKALLDIKKTHNRTPNYSNSVLRIDCAKDNSFALLFLAKELDTAPQILAEQNAAKLAFDKPQEPIARACSDVNVALEPSGILRVSGSKFALRRLSKPARILVQFQ